LCSSPLLCGSRNSRGASTVSRKHPMALSRPSLHNHQAHTKLARSVLGAGRRPRTHYTAARSAPRPPARPDDPRGVHDATRSAAETAHPALSSARAAPAVQQTCHGSACIAHSCHCAVRRAAPQGDCAVAILYINVSERQHVRHTNTASNTDTLHRLCLKLTHTRGRPPRPGAACMPPAAPRAAR
jgi:hypothetical protein